MKTRTFRKLIVAILVLAMVQSVALFGGAVSAQAGLISNLGGTWTAGWGSPSDSFTATENGIQGYEDSWDYFVYINSENVSNYSTIETDITFDSDTGRAAILLRANNDGGYHYAFGIEPSDAINGMENGAIRFSQNNDLINEAYASPVKIQKGETYRVRLEMSYTTVTMYINDQPVMNGEEIKVFDVMGYWNQHKMGFMVRGGTATFNNLSVTGMKTNQLGSWTPVWGSAGDTWVSTVNGVQGTEDSWDFSKYINEIAIGNYSTIEADVTLDTAGVRAGIFFCANDDGGYNFSFGIEAYDTMNNCANGAIRFMKGNEEINQAFESPVMIEAGKTYRLRIEQEYTAAKVYINDQPLMDGENIRVFDTTDNWAYKKVGLIVRAGKATFNNFNVKAIPVGIVSNLTGTWTEYGDGIGYWNHMPAGSEAPNVGWGRARYMNSQAVTGKVAVQADLKLVESGRVAIVVKGNADGSESFSFGIEEGSNVRFERMDEQVNYTVASPVAFAVGQTYTVKVVVDDTTAKMYVNGLPVMDGENEAVFDVNTYSANTNVGVLARAGRALINNFTVTPVREISVLDLITVRNYLVGKTQLDAELLTLADVVGDGNGVDLLDLLELKSRLLK